MIIRRLIVPLTFAAVALHVGQAFAQGAFPAPLTGQDAAASTNGASPVPPDGASDDCLKGLAPLRVEAEKRGKLIKAASERHAPPEEACRLIESFGQSEIKMIKYVEAIRPNAECRRRSATSSRLASRTPRRCCIKSVRWRGGEDLPDRLATSMTLAPVTFEDLGEPRQSRLQMPLLA